MLTVGAFQAKTTLAQLLDRVSKGVKTITHYQTRRSCCYTQSHRRKAVAR